MTRRVYYWNQAEQKKQQACQEALLNLRKARANIDPALLDEARKVIADGLERARAAQEPKPAIDSRTVPVDKQKNLSVIMQYLEMNRDNQALLGKVKTLLTEA